MKTCLAPRPLAACPPALEARVLALACAVLLLLAGRGLAAAPTITSFSPTSGPVGSSVVITGTNFTSLESLTFGGNIAASGSYTATQITATVPSGAQTGVITVMTQGGSASTATAFTVTSGNEPGITSASTDSGLLGQTFSYQITASKSPMSYAASGLPAGLSVNQSTGVISGSPTALGTFSVSISATNAAGTGQGTLMLTVSPLPFFTGEVSLGSGVYYVGFPNGHNFGEYSYLANPGYIYSYDLTSYEYLHDAADGNAGIYFYDFVSGGFFYTSPVFPYPYLFDFKLNAVLFFYQGTSNPRYFYNFGTGKIITK